jgi:membrane protein
LLLFSVVTNAILAAVSAFITGTIPMLSRFQNYLNLLTQFGMVPVLLVIIYKLIPDTDIEWKDVLVGSAITSLLFLAGRYVFAWYLTSSVLQSVYGAAGSLFFLLVWVYYSAQVFYLGAEFTKVYATKYGSRCPERTSEIHPRPE